MNNLTFEAFEGDNNSSTINNMHPLNKKKIVLDSYCCIIINITVAFIIIYNVFGRNYFELKCCAS